MSLKNVFTINNDIKEQSKSKSFDVRQNDSIRFIINVLDKGKPLSEGQLDKIKTVSLVSYRGKATPIVTEGEIIGHQLIFDIGSNETANVGDVHALVQMYDDTGRVSTMSFVYNVLPDPVGEGYEPSEREKTLIEIVLNDAPIIMQEMQDARDLTKQYTDEYEEFVHQFLEIPKGMVSTYADLETTYSNPTNGWIVFVNDEKVMYRYSDDSSSWVAMYTQQQGGEVITSNLQPSNTNSLWIDLSD